MSDFFRVQPDSGYLSYMGRMEEYKGCPRFVFAGSSVTVRFKGTAARCVIANHKFFNAMELGAVLDGRQFKLPFEHQEGDICLDIADGLDGGEHTLCLFKRQDASHYFEFKGFEFPQGTLLLDPLPKPKRRMECYGDSVSAGAVVEAVDFTAKCDPENHEGTFDNAWYSYACITARNLGAQLNDVAQGGIAIFDNTGYYHAPNYIGMQTAYDKVCYFPEAEDGMTSWDFTKYIPQVVLFAVGQNDPHNEGSEDFDITDADYRRKWKDEYKRIILDLRGKYPKARFVLLLTVLMHSPEWDKAVDEIAQEIGDEKITHFTFTRTGKATPGHPRITEQYEMAEQLTAYLSSFGDALWEE